MNNTEQLHGVHLDATHTTMDLPHKRLEIGGNVYYVATYPDGDLAIHEWSPFDRQGYGGSFVTFLLEDGSFETVRGPYHGGDIFDFGKEALVAKHGITGKPSASRIVIEQDGPYGKPKAIYWQEDRMSCEPIGPRLKAALDRELPADRVVKLVYRNSIRHLTPYSLRDGSMCDPLAELLRGAEVVT